MCSNPKPAEGGNALQRSDETFGVSSCSYLHRNADLFVPRLGRAGTCVSLLEDSLKVA